MKHVAFDSLLLFLSANCNESDIWMVLPSANPPGMHTVASLADVAELPFLIPETSIAPVGDAGSRAGSPTSSTSVFSIPSPASSPATIARHASHCAICIRTASPSSVQFGSWRDFRRCIRSGHSVLEPMMLNSDPVSVPGTVDRHRRFRERMKCRHAPTNDSRNSRDSTALILDHVFDVREWQSGRWVVLASQRIGASAPWLTNAPRSLRDNAIASGPGRQAPDPDRPRARSGTL